jgi:hypothetical protein
LCSTYILFNVEKSRHKIYYNIKHFVLSVLTIGDKLLWSSKSVDWHKVVKQALGRLTLFFTTVNHCHCQTHHCKMLNTEKWTTEGDIPRRKNWKGFHKAIWPMDNPPETREMILNFWIVEGAIFLTREKSIIWNCHHYWLDVNAWFTLICFEVTEEWRPKYFVPNSTRILVPLWNLTWDFLHYF